MRFDNQEQAEPDKWDNTHYYGGLGTVLAHRFAKTFEIGAEALAGFSVAFFPDLLPEVGLIHAPHFFIEAGARIALDPSYNFSIDVHPNLKYLRSLADFKDFDGLIFGIGFAASYRFGQDPDAPGAVIRSLRLSELSVPPVFAAMQSYYVRNPAGGVVLTNTEKHSITDIEVSFFQPGYMDSPTPAASFPEIAAGESRRVELYASYNQEVFATEGITPLTGEVIISYKSRGRAAEQRQSVAYDLHDKTAVTWDDDRKVAAFITPSDSALRNYTSFIRQVCKDVVVSGYNESLQAAVQVFQALGEIGCLYQADPTMPFTKVQGDPRFVDSVSLPRDTLKRITGDCDDLTVLYCSLLETVGIETAFITVPGHIYSAFNTRVAVGEYAKIASDRRGMIALDGELWIPVEITLIGETDFIDAWRRGAEQWLDYENEPEKRVMYRTRSCQELYRPVGLKETDLGLQYGSKENILEGFRKEVDQLIDGVLGEMVSTAEKRGSPVDYNRLGIAYAKFHRYERAEEAFNEALRIDPQY
ncbi:MAG: tetratricopeptide repeat protein, partial [Chloroflexi bacterium]|nr:tetratricopeptide repeat protein [Chloroflexota bacterium]